jgi:hypothetical protein
MAIWEYKVVELEPSGIPSASERARILNALGRDGWELVSVTSDDCGGAKWAYLKRRAE